MMLKGGFAIIGILISSGGASLQAQVQVLRIKNDADGEKSIRVDIKSERPHNPSKPWVSRQIAPGAVAEVKLQSPDRFIVKLYINGDQYQSAPMPLKKAIAPLLLWTMPTRSTSEISMPAMPRGRGPRLATFRASTRDRNGSRRPAGS